MKIEFKLYVFCSTCYTELEVTREYFDYDDDYIINVEPCKICLEEQGRKTDNEDRI